MSITEQLRIDIEAAASALGKSPSTIGKDAGQGGQFYARLCEGKRVWPETADAVRARIEEMKRHASSHGSANDSDQVGGEE